MGSAHGQQAVSKTFLGFSGQRESQGAGQNLTRGDVAYKLQDARSFPDHALYCRLRMFFWPADDVLSQRQGYLAAASQTGLAVRP